MRKKIIACPHRIATAPGSLATAKSDQEEITPQNAAYLRDIATKTWQYFADNVNENTHHLPPDYVEYHFGTITKKTILSIYEKLAPDRQQQLKDLFLDNFDDTPDGSTLLLRKGVTLDQTRAISENLADLISASDTVISTRVTRTSTSDIGGYIQAIIQAMHLGILDQAEGLQRLADTLSTMEQLLQTPGQSYHGQLFNWYAIDSGETPHGIWGNRETGAEFVSTVDAGNLAAGLRMAAQGLKELTIPEDTTDLQNRLRAIYDNMDFSIFYNPTALHVHGSDPFTPGELNIDRARIEMNNYQDTSLALRGNIAKGMDEWESVTKEELAAGFNNILDDPQFFLEMYKTELEKKALAAETQAFEAIPLLNTVAHLVAKVLHWTNMFSFTSNTEYSKQIESITALQAELHHATGNADKTIRSKVRTLIQQAFPETFEKGLLASGVNVIFTDINKTEAKANVSLQSFHYNMLMSEARSAYYLAILKKDIPETAWQHLSLYIEGMGVVNHALLDNGGILSWSGTYMEYGLPSLYFDERQSPVLHRALKLHLEEQLAPENAFVQTMAGQQHTVRGTSEVARRPTPNEIAEHHIRDYTIYRATGLATSAQDRQHTQASVVAGYVSTMAAPFAPNTMAENIRELDALGLLGHWGLMASISEAGIMPRSYPHHQGWGLTGLGQALVPGLVGLIERSLEPNDAATLRRLKETPREKYLIGKPQQGNAYEPDATLSARKTEVVGQFGHSVYAPDSGVGWSQWSASNFALATDQIFYIKATDSDDVLAIGLDAPKSAKWVDGTKTYTYQQNLTDGTQVDITLSLSFSPRDNVSIWDIEISHNCESDRHFEISAYNKWILDPPDRYEANKLFSAMHIRTFFLQRLGAIAAQRKTVSAEQQLQPYGFLALAGSQAPPVTGWDTDNRTILGNATSLTSPEAVRTGTYGEHEDYTGDPASLLATRVKIEPHSHQKTTFIVGSARTQAQVATLIDRYRSPNFLQSVSGEQPYPALPQGQHFAYVKELYNRARRARQFFNLNPVTRAKEALQGAFSADGWSYHITNPESTPTRWGYTMANRHGYGTTSFADQMGTSFNKNAQQNRITPYPDEMKNVMITDSITGKTWAMTANHASIDGAYATEITPAYTRYVFTGKEDGDLAGLTLTMTVFLDPENPLEAWQVEANYTGGKDLSLDVSSFVKFDLAPQYPVLNHLTSSTYNADHTTHYSHNPHSLFPDAVAFHSIAGITGPIENKSFFSDPDDPFAGLSFKISLSPETQNQTFAFLLGQAESQTAAERLVSEYQDLDRINRSLIEREASVRELFGTTQIDYGDPDIDPLINHWLLSQATQSHLFGRQGAEQSGGALGFRDQLQTVTNLLRTGNEFLTRLARELLLFMASEQTESGAVRHWTHKETGLGILNRISDNLVWLPWAVTEYITVTGNDDILDEQVPYIKLPEAQFPGGELPDGVQDRVFKIEARTAPASIFEHVTKVFDRILEKGLGVHGIPLIGSGDWNDAFNRWGTAGKGESIWLGFFLYYNLTNFSNLLLKLADQKEETEGPGSARAALYRDTATHYLAAANTLKQNLIESCWENDHFIRAFNDDGKKLDFQDAIIGPWAILSFGERDERARQTFETAMAELFDAEQFMTKLFTAPLDLAYPPGKREAAAQYTHAATWPAKAAVLLEDGNLADKYFRVLLPTVHARLPQYGGPPFIQAADINGPAALGTISSVDVEFYKRAQGTSKLRQLFTDLTDEQLIFRPGLDRKNIMDIVGDDAKLQQIIAPALSKEDRQLGGVGWTGYTGAAAWTYRIFMEDILGIQFRDGHLLTIKPCIRTDKETYSVTHQRSPGGPIIKIRVNNPDHVSTGVANVTLNGIEHDGNTFDLTTFQQGQTYDIVVTMGARPST